MMAEVGSPSRASPSGTRRVLSTPSSPFSPGSRFKSNNDQLEKKAKRATLARQLAEKSMAGSPYKSSSAKKERSDDRLKPIIDPTDIILTSSPSRGDVDSITDVYANCIKLCTENKINQKNTWQLPLIDYMNDVMKTKHGEMTNFQVREAIPHLYA